MKNDGTTAGEGQNTTEGFVASASSSFSAQSGVYDAKEHIDDLEKESVDLKRRIVSYQGELHKVNSFMVGVVVAVSITFIVTTITLYWGEILNNKSDKDLYLKYNDVYRDYHESILDQQKQIEKLSSDLKVLKVKNYLK